MVNAVLDYVLLLDRLIIKLFVHVAENDYYVYIWLSWPLLFGVIEALMAIINNKCQSIQDEILTNYIQNQITNNCYFSLIDGLETNFKETSSKDNPDYDDLERMKNIQKQIHYIYSNRLLNCNEEEGIEWLKM